MNDAVLGAMLLAFPLLVWVLYMILSRPADDFDTDRHTGNGPGG